MTDDMTDSPTPDESTPVLPTLSAIPKNKKKKKKNHPNSTPAVEQPVSEPTTFILPVLPDEWLVLPEEKDEDDNIITEERFVFFKEGVEIVNLPFTESNFAGMYKVLSNRFGHSDYIPDHWTIKEPLTSDSDPVMSLSLEGRVLAATSLDQTALKKMVKALQQHIVKPPTLSRWFSKWWEKHKVLRVFASFAMLPVFISLIFAVVWGLQH